MNDAGGAGWTWIRRYASVGFCLTAVEGRTDREILNAFGVSPESVARLTMAEADAEFGFELPVIRAGAVGGVGFAFENFGTVGSQGEAAAELSHGGRAAVVWRHGFLYLEDAVRVCSFEPLFPAQRDGHQPDRFVDQMRAVGLPPDGAVDLDRVDPTVAALELATLVCGLRLTEDIVTGPLLSGLVEPDMSWLEE